LSMAATKFGVDAGVVSLLYSLTTAEKALRPFTIVRIRIHIGVESDQQVASEAVASAMGVAVVSDQAEAIGITALPTPLTDLSSDLWLAHQFLFTEFTFATASGFIGTNMHRETIDSKAMRKVEDGQDVVVTAESSIIGEGAILTVGGRMLIKLH